MWELQIAYLAMPFHVFAFSKCQGQITKQLFPGMKRAESSLYMGIYGHTHDIHDINRLKAYFGLVRCWQSETVPPVCP